MSQKLYLIKAILKANVENYLKIHFIHNFALIFDPKRKYLKLLDEKTDKKQAIEFLIENMRNTSLRSKSKILFKILNQMYQNLRK